MNSVIQDWFNRNTRRLVEFSDLIHGFAEIALEEVKSAGAAANFLKEEGFSVSSGLSGMATAFSASWGSGKPVLGFLGEYDALPGLQNGCVPRQEGNGGNGHGCGHNLLCAATVGAVVSLKEAMEKQKIPGTIIFYGCPAEEIILGKIKMVRNGDFNGLDAAIAFHPSDRNRVCVSSNQAMDSKYYTFYGRTAHAAAAPEMGRSALDAAELMNVGVNFLREHVPDHTRIHYVYLDGGNKPNIVPDYARVWYFIRARDRKTVNYVSARIDKIAQGAALMTDTRSEMEYLTGCFDTFINFALCRSFYASMQKVEPIRFSAKEKAFAREMQKNAGLEAQEEPLDEDIQPLGEKVEYAMGSTDVADVSRVCPTVTINTTCVYKDAPGHNWVYTSCAGTEIGHRGMLYAARIMAQGALDILENPRILEEAGREFDENISLRPEVVLPG
jgi:aminobenzoyl-glutamate utilization protein B